MEEYINSRKQKKKNSFASLPPIRNAQRPLKQILNTQNAFKLGRVGVSKSKFINFDLKYTQDQQAREHPQGVIKIPMMIYNKNKFSPFRQKADAKSPPHLLLISRTKQTQSLPSLTRPPLTSIQSAKFKKQNEFIVQNPHLFIT